MFEWVCVVGEFAVSTTLSTVSHVAETTDNSLSLPLAPLQKPQYDDVVNFLVQQMRGLRTGLEAKVEQIMACRITTVAHDHCHTHTNDFNAK